MQMQWSSMHSPTSVVVLTVVMWAGLSCVCAYHVRTVELQNVGNRTVCPMEVHVDEDPNRSPRRIKMLRCAGAALQGCHDTASDGQRWCCNTHGRGTARACAELHDRVHVHYRTSPAKSVLYDVVVGCVCVLHRTNRAVQIPLP